MEQTHYSTAKTTKQGQTVGAVTKYNRPEVRCSLSSSGDNK